jgi:phosphoribosyl 1,2-cyclic phosphodiesterase
MRPARALQCPSSNEEDAMDDALEIRFWGVRGSLPSPGPDTVLVGGNTACVEISGKGERIVLDAGTGLRALGDALLAKRQHERTTLLLSHVHWDHLLGIPFYSPLYMPGCSVDVLAGPMGMPLRDVLARQMTAPVFPVELDAVAAELRAIDLDPRRRFDVGPFEVRMARLAHPDPTYAFRIDLGDRSVVYATDVEHGESGPDEELVALARGADLLIYDAQYLPEEYPSKRGWGHSTYEAGAAVARAAGVHTLALFHHDPRRTDDGVAEIVRRARQGFSPTVAAREGMALRFELRDALPRHEAIAV